MQKCECCGRVAAPIFSSTHGLIAVCTDCTREWCELRGIYWRSLAEIIAEMPEAS